MHALDTAAHDLRIKGSAIEREYADRGDMRRDVDANDDRKGVIEPDDLDEQWRAAEQLDIADQQPVDHGKAADAQDADDQADERPERNGADGVGDGKAEPKPEQVTVFAKDREIPDV